MNTIRRLAPWALLVAAGAFFFGLPGFVAGVAVLALEEGLQGLRDAIAMKGANAAALMRKSGEWEAMAKKQEAFEERLKLLETPERLAQTKEILAQFKNVIPGLRR